MRGSIVQRSPGSYTLRYELPRAPDGRRQQRWETIHGSKRDAETLLAKRIHDVDSRAHVLPQRRRFNELADAFLLSRKSSIAPTTYRLYQRQLRLHLRPVLGMAFVHDVEEQHIELLLIQAANHSRTKAHGRAIGNRTRRNLLTLLRACFRYAIRNRWITHNPTDAVATCGENDHEPELFDLLRVQELLQAVRNTEIANEVLFAIGTGVRRGEICGLQWSDLDLTEGQFTVRRAAIELDGEVVYRRPKSKQSRRSDRLPKTVLEMLTEHRSRQAELSQYVGENLVGNDAFVFTRANGTPWKPNELSRQFSRFVQRAGIAHLRFHDLRHANASLAYAAGVPLLTISKSLGHATIAITANTYVHLLADHSGEKAAKVDRYIGEVRKAHVRIDRTNGSETFNPRRM